MHIGEAERHSGVPAKTIRYYEEVGLVQPHRLANRYRSFSEKDIHRLGFLHRARCSGFSLGDCRLLLSLYEDRNRTAADVKSVVLEHVNRIDRKIDDLLMLRHALAVLIDARHGDNRPDYPILL